MDYNIKLTEEFIEEVNDICDYITNKLKEPNIANNLRKNIIHKIIILEKSPRLFPKIEKISQTKQQYRRIIVNNFIILYTINEKENRIYVAHIYYKRKNYLS